jgi:LAS superfamily LD-carboxypeptidase LdcB
MKTITFLAGMLMSCSLAAADIYEFNREPVQPAPAKQPVKPAPKPATNVVKPVTRPADVKTAVTQSSGRPCPTDNNKTCSER